MYVHTYIQYVHMYIQYKHMHTWGVGLEVGEKGLGKMHLEGERAIWCCVPRWNGGSACWCCGK